MAAIPPWLDKLAKSLGGQKPAAGPMAVRPGTAILKPKAAPQPQGREITLRTGGAVGRAQPPRHSLPAPARKVTPASMVYALAAGVLFTLAIYNLFHGSIFNGIVTLVPAGSLAVLAYKYIQ